MIVTIKTTKKKFGFFGNGKLVSELIDNGYQVKVGDVFFQYRNHDMRKETVCVQRALQILGGESGFFNLQVYKYIGYKCSVENVIPNVDAEQVWDVIVNGL